MNKNAGVLGLFCSVEYWDLNSLDTFHVFIAKFTADYKKSQIYSPAEASNPLKADAHAYIYMTVIH